LEVRQDPVSKKQKQSSLFLPHQAYELVAISVVISHAFAGWLGLACLGWTQLGSFAAPCHGRVLVHSTCVHSEVRDKAAAQGRLTTRH
jgi:hypothetical protein